MTWSTLDAAEEIRCSESNVGYLIRNGHLEATKDAHGNWRIDPDSVARYLKAHPQPSVYNWRPRRYA